MNMRFYGHICINYKYQTTMHTPHQSGLNPNSELKSQTHPKRKNMNLPPNPISMA